MITLSSFLALGLTFVASLSWYLLVRKHLSSMTLGLLIGVGAGAMTSISLTHILPEAAEQSEYAGIAFFIGFCLVFLLDYFHCTHPHLGHEEAHDHKEHEHDHSKPRSLASFGGLFVHTAFDGVAIMSAFTVSSITGWIVTIAVIVHQIPVSLALAGIAISSRYTKTQVIGLFAGFWGSVILGALLISILPLGPYEPLIVALAGGTLLYVGASDLLPELRSHSGAGVRMILSFLLGGAIPIIAHLALHSH